MSHSCHICGKYFSKPFNLRRHKRKVHDQKPTDSIRMVTNGSAVLQHPFTCTVAGCTQSGKTVWVKSLLENAQKAIQQFASKHKQQTFSRVCLRLKRDVYRWKRNVSLLM
jgi:hypothetical protein